MKIVEHLCITCKNFIKCENECKERHFLNGMNEYEIVAECEDYTENKE